MHVRQITMIAVTLAVLAAGCGGTDAGSDGPLRAGRDIYGSICSACHGGAGQGGVGPALDGVLESFPACSDHIEWVTLGSNRWRTEVGDTYGATAKPVTGAMPEGATIFTAGEIASVAFFERVQYGGQDEEEAAADCGVPTANP